MSPVSTELAVFSDVFADHAKQFIKDNRIILEAQVSIDEHGQMRLNAKQCWDFAKARERFGERVELVFRRIELKNSQIDDCIIALKSSEKGQLRCLSIMKMIRLKLLSYYPNLFWIFSPG